MYPNIINPYGQYNPYVMPKHLAKSLKKLSKVPFDPFIPATINFYDPLTGKQGPPYNPYGNMDAQTFSDNGSEVSITGSADDVDRVMGLLRNATFSKASGEPKYVPIGDPFDKTAASGPTDSTSDGFQVSPTRFGRAMILSTPTGGQQFSGSGILLIEKTGQTDANVILVYTRRNTCEDMGGSLDSRLIPSMNALVDNAKKEASEESQNLFLVNKLKLDSLINGVSRSVDIQSDPSGPYYRCYIVCIQHAGIVPDLPSLFASNRTAMASEPGMEWRESISLVKFNITLLFAACKEKIGDVNCVDVMGRTQTIHARVVSVVNKLLAENRPTLTAVVNTPITVSPIMQSIASPIIGYPSYGYMGGLNQVTSFII